jgi:phosphatidylglycerol:prolipoprotein diacylglycerol transferase
MRQTLIRIFLDEPWALWQVDAKGIPGPGIGILVLVAALVWVVVQIVRRRQLFARAQRSALGWIVGALIAVNFAPAVGARMGLTSLPVFGYGFMLLVGFLAAMALTRRRARREGLEPDQIVDIGFWVLIAGVLGARVWYLIQYADRIFADKSGIDVLKAAINVSEGGLVLYGGLLCGAAAYFLFCYRYQIHPLRLADIATPALFVGIGFGRIGCLLNGCCYGDRCELPWAITFPQGSVTWEAMVLRGLLDPASAATFPLHPTQIYSSINAFLLAWVTAAFYPRRRHEGETLALGCILYAITRFTIEFLRADELGKWGTGLTISQLASVAILTTGIALLGFLNLRKPGRATLSAS